MKRKPAARTKTLTCGERITREGKTRTTGATISAAPHEPAFRQVVAMIEAARDHAYQAVNTGLIDLYWRVGEFISRKIAGDGWGKNTVGDLSAFIRARRPGISGFSASHLWRMRQFHDTYAGQPKPAALLRELPWSHNLLILGGCKRPEARKFYLRLAVHERWGKRELDRQLAGVLFERTVLSPPKVSPLVTQLHPDVRDRFGRRLGCLNFRPGLADFVDGLAGWS